MEKLLLVAVGGAAGAVLRFVTVGWVGRVSGELAYGTLFVNVLGSFLMGLLASLLVARMPDAMDRLAPLLMTGVLGGFTTFSAYSLDAIRLYDDGRVIGALAYAGGSVVLSIAGVVAGIALARAVL